MIRSVRHKGLKRLIEDGDRSKLPSEMVERIEYVLFMLSVAKSIDELNVPGFRLHMLKGDLKGRYSITVRATWRIVFRFEDDTASDLDFMDYH